MNNKELQFVFTVLIDLNQCSVCNKQQVTLVALIIYKKNYITNSSNNKTS